MKRGRGRPEFEITDEMKLRIRELARLQATDAEIAAELGVSLRCIEYWKIRRKDYVEWYRDGKNQGLVSLRRSMFRSAIEEGNPTMMVWLSKNLLGYTDKIEQRHSGPNGGAIPLTIDLLDSVPSGSGGSLVLSGDSYSLLTPSTSDTADQG